MRGRSSCWVRRPASALEEWAEAAPRRSSPRPRSAGLMLHERTPSADGLETNFAVNTLACFALTLALQPALFAAGPARVVFVSSGGQYTEPLVVDDLQAEKMRKFDGTAQVRAPRVVTEAALLGPWGMVQACSVGWSRKRPPEPEAPA